MSKEDVNRILNEACDVMLFFLYLKRHWMLILEHTVRSRKLLIKK